MSVSSNKLKENSRDLLREEEEEEPGDDEVDRQEFQTTSIRVLLVDSDYQSLCFMKNLLTRFSYQVKIFRNGDDAIAFLMKNKHEIDLVIWDDHVPVVYGVEDVISTINKDMDLPVVIISHEYKKETVMKFLEYGACDFLVKPVSKEVTAVLWQHVYRKKMSRSGYGSVESADPQDLYQESSKNVVKDTGEQNKKRRVVWKDELHDSFEKAVAKLGIDKAIPSAILICMEKDIDVQGLTRDQVASHLQKYRQKVEKESGVPHETRQDSGSNPALTASIPLLNSSFIGQETEEEYGWRYAESEIVYTDYEPKPLLDSSFNRDQAASNAHETRQDSIRRNAGPSTSLTASTPLLNSSLIDVPIQYTLNISSFMTNPFANVPYTDSFQLQQPQQHYKPKPLLDSSFNLHAREPYFMYDQAIARALIQYPSTNYLTMTNSSYMTNPLAYLPYTDSLHQPLQQQQQQQYDDSYLQLPSVIPTQVSSAMENLNLSKFPPGNFDL